MSRASAASSRPSPETAEVTFRQSGFTASATPLGAGLRRTIHYDRAYAAAIQPFIDINRYTVTLPGGHTVEGLGFFQVTGLRIGLDEKTLVSSQVLTATGAQGTLTFTITRDIHGRVATATVTLERPKLAAVSS